MTIRDLIYLLLEHPPHSQVVIDHDGGTILTPDRIDNVHGTVCIFTEEV